MNKDTIKISIATLAALGGGLVAGTQVNRPECAYVIQGKQEVCLTAEQAKAITDSMASSTTEFGFDNIKFSDPVINKK